jgi:hypothetical protein
MDRDNRDFLELLRDTEAAIEALVATLGARLLRIILANGQRRGRQTLEDLIDLAIRQYVDSYRVIVTDAVANAGGIQADKNAAKLLPLLERAGAGNEQEFMDSRFKGYREVIRQRFPTQRHLEDRKTFEQRVVNVRRGFERTVYGMVQTGVDQGIDPRKVAYQIRDFVVMSPKGQPSEAFREAARLRDRASTYVYRGAPAGSVQYNSIRIARTEMAAIYRRSVTDFFDDRPYTEGYDWVLSNRHPKFDRCDNNKAGSPYASAAQVPSTHPNCLCRLVARLMAQEDIKRLIASGALD